MSDLPRTTLVVGGTSGIGLEIARDAAARGESVVITGRDDARTQQIAATIEGSVTGLALELSRPESLAGALVGVGPVNGLVLSAIYRDANTVKDYDISGAIALVTLKLVGYTEVIHALGDRLVRERATGIVVFGGRAKDAPYPGSTTVSTINGGVTGMVTALALELAPIRVNALHPGIIGDSPFWADKPAALDAVKARTPGGELATMQDVVGATRFLLDNHGVSAQNLMVDRGVNIT